MQKINLSIIAASLLLAGCTTLGPDYQRPALDVPNTLNFSAVGNNLKNNPVADWRLWFKSFQDPVLEKLLDEAAANNQDLALAAARVEEARTAITVAAANHSPSVDATFNSTKSRTSEQSGKLPSGVSPIAKDFQLSLGASYEIDFWGKFSRADEGARARMLSQEANRGVVLTSLYANLIQSYFALRAFDAQHKLAETTLQTRLENLRLQKQRFSAGVIGELDLHQATSEVSAAEVATAQAKQSVSNMESALAVLLGRSPVNIAKPVIARGSDINVLYQRLSLPTDLPSDLLNRRPDILAAEQTLIAANADIGQAKTLFFPSIKLVSGIGYESPALQDLVSPTAMLWSVGANLAQPIFRAGATTALVAGAEARKNQAMSQYVQTVQNAFRDVHDALVNLSADGQIQDATKRRITALRDTHRLAQLRYQNGYSSFLEVLNAQRGLFQAESSLIDIQRAHLSAAVSLYKAVGGGWEVPQSLATAR